MGKKAEEFSTHSWKLYIRGPNEEDLTSFIDKVAFTLHPSFAEPVRGSFLFLLTSCFHQAQFQLHLNYSFHLIIIVVKAPPFEVSETGWGEFEASIRLYFKDPEEQPVDLFHLIKLYPANAPQQVSTIKKVI